MEKISCTVGCRKSHLVRTGSERIFTSTFMVNWVSLFGLGEFRPPAGKCFKLFFAITFLLSDQFWEEIEEGQ